MERDLSIYHSPVSRFLESGDSSVLHTLSTDQIEFYKENGYLTGLPLLSEEQVTWLRRGFIGWFGDGIGIIQAIVIHMQQTIELVVIKPDGIEVKVLLLQAQQFLSEFVGGP